MCYLLARMGMKFELTAACDVERYTLIVKVLSTFHHHVVER